MAALGQRPDSEVRHIFRSHVSNFGIEVTPAKLLIQCGFDSEVRMRSRRQQWCGLL